MIPALHYLDEVVGSLPLNEVTFFIFTGGLSSVLDNAPTYATFLWLPDLRLRSLGPVFLGVSRLACARRHRPPRSARHAPGRQQRSG